MDRVLDTWLGRQYAEGMALCAASDVLALLPEPGRRPPQRFIARFSSPTMVRIGPPGSPVTRWDGFAALFQFPSDYLRSAPDAARIVSLLAPLHAFHPNVAPPFICIGRIVPGTGLCELIYRVHEIMTFRKVTPREDDALNPDACVWARNNAPLSLLSAAPLLRRPVAFSVEQIHPQEVQREAHRN